jgi:hypothetical protein
MRRSIIAAYRDAASPERLGSDLCIVEFAKVARSPGVSLSSPVIVHVAPGNRLELNEMPGPPPPEALVVVNNCLASGEALEAPTPPRPL